MSNYLHQTGKESINQPVFLGEEGQKFANPKISDNLGNKQTLTTAQPVGQAHIGSGMPEAYMSAGGYYTANNTGFAAMSFPNFNQPAQWSTGTNNPPAAPQSYDHTAMQYSTLGAAPNAPANADATQNHQYVTADHLFNQNNSTYQSAFSAAPFMNGSWSYFNNPSSYFFPTGNGDLNLNWGTTAAPTDNPNNALFQDLYKPPPPPTELEKQSKGDATNPTSELSSGFENGEVKPPAVVETVEQSLSGMSVSEKEVEKSLESSAPPPSLSSQTVTAPVKPIAPVSTSSGHSNAPAKPVSWAAVASKPATSKPPPKKPPQKAPTTVPNTKPNYSTQNGTASSNAKGKQQPPTGGRWSRPNQNGGNQNSNNTGIDNTVAIANDSHLDINRMKDNSPLLKKLMHKFNFNPRELNIETKNARFFIIKSYSEDDIFRSIKYSSWTSTEHGNRRLNDAFSEQQRTGVKTPIYLLFSVNSSGHFCGVAEMMSKVDFDVETGIFVQDKWKGRFDVRWVYVKDVPNNTLRHIRLENNENKPVTNSRDTQEVHPDKAKQVLKIVHNYKAQTSIFDDFSHYEKRQEDDAKLRSKKMPEPNL